VTLNYSILNYTVCSTATNFSGIYEYAQTCNVSLLNVSINFTQSINVNVFYIHMFGVSIATANITMNNISTIG